MLNLYFARLYHLVESLLIIAQVITKTFELDNKYPEKCSQENEFVTNDVVFY